MKYLKIILLGVFSFLTELGMAQKDTTIYSIVEQQPEYPEGLAAFFKYISQNTKYPEICRENGIESTMYIKFVVEKNGSIINVYCTRGCACQEWCSSVSIAIKNMPKWKAGRQNGKPVRVSYTLPLSNANSISSPT